MTGLQFISTEHIDNGIDWKGSYKGYTGNGEQHVYDICREGNGYALFAYPKSPQGIYIHPKGWVELSRGTRVATLMAWAEWYEVTCST